MTDKAKGGGSRRVKGGRSKSNSTEPLPEGRYTWERVSSDDDEQPTGQEPSYETNAEGVGPSWEEAFGVKNQKEFTEKALDRDKNPLKLDGKEYDLAVR